MRVQNVIIGGGLAGGMVAQEYREQGGDGSVLVIARESHVPYHRPPLTKEFLRGEKPVDEVYMHPQEWWAEQGVDVRTGTSATAIDRDRRSVVLSTGEEVEYERLALATGATPRQLPGARTMRTLDDSQALAETLAGGSGHLGVIGGGFIGVEAAASARMKGWEVTMAVRESVVWEHLFGAEVAAYFQRHLEQHGVHVNTGTAELPEGNYTLTLAGIGVTPNVELAEAAGLEVENGVLVDEHLRAAEDVWAIGDIANYQSAVHGRRLRIEHWDVALNQGGYVGRSWAGKETEPYTVVPYFFSDIGDWTWFEYVGPGTGRVDVRGSMDDDDFVAYYPADAEPLPRRRRHDPGPRPARRGRPARAAARLDGRRARPPRGLRRRAGRGRPGAVAPDRRERHPAHVVAPQRRSGGSRPTRRRGRGEHRQRDQRASLGEPRHHDRGVRHARPLRRGAVGRAVAGERPAALGRAGPRRPLDTADVRPGDSVRRRRTRVRRERARPLPAARAPRRRRRRVPAGGGDRRRPRGEARRASELAGPRGHGSGPPRPHAVVPRSAGHHHLARTSRAGGQRAHDAPRRRRRAGLARRPARQGTGTLPRHRRQRLRLPRAPPPHRRGAVARAGAGLRHARRCAGRCRAKRPQPRPLHALDRRYRRGDLPRALPSRRRGIPHARRLVGEWMVDRKLP